MNLSLDYDDTYTRDPAFWDAFVVSALRRGHKVYLVTLRYDNTEANEVLQALGGKVTNIFFTCRKSKRKFMYDKGIRIDVWIDDTPDFIVGDAFSGNTTEIIVA